MTISLLSRHRQSQGACTGMTAGIIMQLPNTPLSVAGVVFNELSSTSIAVLLKVSI